MTTEDVEACVVFGSILGVVSFFIGRAKVHRWSMGSRRRPPASGGDALVGGLVDPSSRFNRVADLLELVVVAALLGYGAWVAPKLRIALASASVTAFACWLVWRAVAERRVR